MEREKLSLEEAIGSAIKNVASDTAHSAHKLTGRAEEMVDSASEHFSGGTIGEAAEAVSQGVRRTADYLQQEGMGGVVEDLELLIRRYPLQALMLGVGCGYLLSRLRPE